MKLTMKQARGNVSQADIANELDVSLSTYKRYEKGETQISIVQAIRFCDYFGLQLTDVDFDGHQEKLRREKLK